MTDICNFSNKPIDITNKDVITNKINKILDLLPLRFNDNTTIEHYKKIINDNLNIIIDYFTIIYNCIEDNQNPIIFMKNALTLLINNFGKVNLVLDLYNIVKSGTFSTDEYISIITKNILPVLEDNINKKNYDVLYQYIIILFSEKIYINKLENYIELYIKIFSDKFNDLVYSDDQTSFKNEYINVVTNIDPNVVNGIIYAPKTNFTFDDIFKSKYLYKTEPTVFNKISSNISVSRHNNISSKAGQSITNIKLDNNFKSNKSITNTSGFDSLVSKMREKLENQSVNKDQETEEKLKKLEKEEQEIIEKIEKLQNIAKVKEVKEKEVKEKELKDTEAKDKEVKEKIDKELIISENSKQEKIKNDIIAQKILEIAKRLDEEAKKETTPEIKNNKRKNIFVENNVKKKQIINMNNKINNIDIIKNNNLIGTVEKYLFETCKLKNSLSANIINKIALCKNNPYNDLSNNSDNLISCKYPINTNKTYFYKNEDVAKLAYLNKKYIINSLFYNQFKEYDIDTQSILSNNQNIKRSSLTDEIIEITYDNNDLSILKNKILSIKNKNNSDYISENILHLFEIINNDKEFNHTVILNIQIETSDIDNLINNNYYPALLLKIIISLLTNHTINAFNISYKAIKDFENNPILSDNIKNHNKLLYLLPYITVALYGLPGLINDKYGNSFFHNDISLAYKNVHKASNIINTQYFSDPYSELSTNIYNNPYVIQIASSDVIYKCIQEFKLQRIDKMDILFKFLLCKYKFTSLDIFINIIKYFENISKNNNNINTIFYNDYVSLLCKHYMCIVYIYLKEEYYTAFVIYTTILNKYDLQEGNNIYNNLYHIIILSFLKLSCIIINTDFYTKNKDVINNNINTVLNKFNDIANGKINNSIEIENILNFIDSYNNNYINKLTDLSLYSVNNIDENASYVRFIY